jgi:hypothetical protein
MQALVIVSALIAAIAGCASIAAEDVAGLAGTWQGWLVTGSGFTLLTFVVRGDGSFAISGTLVRATGRLVVTEGKLRFDGTGPWRGTLVPEGGGERRALRIERDDRLYRGTLHPIPPAS